MAYDLHAAPEHFELFYFTLSTKSSRQTCNSSIATMEADKTNRHYNTSTNVSQSESKIH